MPGFAAVAVAIKPYSYFAAVAAAVAAIEWHSAVTLLFPCVL